MVIECDGLVILPYFVMLLFIVAYKVVAGPRWPNLRFSLALTICES